MSHENHVTSPPGSGRSKRSREESQSIAVANSIHGSANPSLRSTPVTPLSYPSARGSEIDAIRTKIESKETEIKKKEEILENFTKEWGTATQKMSADLRQIKLIEIGSLTKSIEQLRDEINHIHEKEKLLLQDTKDSAATQKEYGVGNSEKVMRIIESLEIEGMKQRPNIAQMFIPAGSIPVLRIPRKNGFVVLPKEFLTGSGIGRPDADTHLFIRKSVLEQFKFIKEKVIAKGLPGSIHGQPGTGKSTATYLYASTLCRSSWIVIWIHLEWWSGRPRERVKCVIMTGLTKKVASFEMNDLYAFLSSGRVFISSKEVLIIDGLTFHSYFSKLAVSSATWWETDKKNRRLINVSSMAAQGKYKPVEIQRDGNVEFLQISWTLKEYIKAIQNTDFLRSVEGFLDADPQPGETSKEKVISKFYYSGGCARSMFQFSTLEVKKLLMKSIQSLFDKSRILNADTGFNSEHACHNLLNVFEDDKTELVSAYAALELALQKGPDYIISLAKNPLMLGNPFIKGGFFELLFFSHAKLGKIPLQDKDGEKFIWVCGASVTVFKPMSPNSVSCVLGEWLMPNIWNQGGYDGVFLEDTNGRNVIRFVQTTTRDSHDVKLQFFIELINRLKTRNVFDVDEVEIFFVVPTHKLASYKIGPISHPASLKTFCWPTCADKVRKKIQILGLDFPVAY